MIKKVVVRRKIFRGRGIFAEAVDVFEKYIAENGNAVCAINYEIVEPNKGNEIYRELKAHGVKRIEREIVEASDSEILDMIEGGIDEYAEYIEDYKQYKEACEYNDRLYKLASEFRKVAGR